MKKQTYQKPEMRVVKIQQAQMLCTSTESNVGITGGNSGYDGPARARQYNGGIDWDDWDE